MGGEPGRIGPYRIERVLGRGGMGAVYLARGPDGGRVAVKLLFAAGTRAEARFDRERMLGEAIDHPAFVAVLDAGEHEGQPWLAMEYVEGRTLEAIRKERGRLPPGSVLGLGRQLAGGLAALHARGITHRDVKPDNLMVDPAGRLRIMDLGLAKVRDGTLLTATGSVVGTPWFLAPEQLGGAGVGPAADLFAATLLLFLLLTGRHPFRDEGEKDFLAYFQKLRATPPRPWHRAGVGGPLDSFFRRGLALDPAARFPDAARMIDEFAFALEAQRAGPRSVEETLEVDASAGPPDPPAPGPPAPERRPSPPPPAPGPAPPPPRRFPWLPTVLALLALGILAAGRRGGASSIPLIAGWEGLETPAGPRLLVRLAPTSRLAAKGAALLPAPAESQIRVLAVEPGAPVVELSAGGTTPLLALETGSIPWRRPAVLGRGYEANGDLSLRVARSEWGALSLRRGPGGARIVDGSGGAGPCRFRVPDPEGRGTPALELCLAVPGTELVLAALPPDLPAAARAAPLLAELAELDPEPVLADPQALAELRAAWEKEGVLAEYAALRRWLAARLVPLEAADRELCMQLPKLGLLEAAWLRAGLDSPIDLRKHGLSRPLRRVDFKWARPVPSPSAATWEFRKDYFTVQTRRLKNLIESPTELLSRPLPPVELAAPGPGSGWPWLVLHLRRADVFCQHFYAVATVNGAGPFWFYEGPRRDFRAELKRRFPARSWYHLRFRSRIPPDLLKARNEVKVRFVPWSYARTDFEDMVSLRAISLEPGDQGP